jgi:glyoxylase-like metal-dependent hydrolase (beta-lactamase superfamily II)/ferredoxin
MANPKRKLPDNVPGEFYVDNTCIDCDTCRWLAPETFTRSQDQSVVQHQPDTPEARQLALRAMVACPTASIGTITPAPDLPLTRREFPIPIDGEVYYCGYHSSKSFGAASYLIRRPEGNVLVDSPRQSEILADNIAVLGGVRWFYLTHGDDVADHQFWHERFGCERILHAGDITPGTRSVERILPGDETVKLAEDLNIIPVPGHTRGSTVLLYRDTYLFSGDHLAFSKKRGHLYAFKDACWYSWGETIRSMEKLRNYSFTWVLPGHGRRFYANRDEMSAELETCIRWMHEQR